MAQRFRSSSLLLTHRNGDTSMISAKQLKAAFPKCLDPSLWANELSSAASKYEINTKQRFAMWAAQCAHESQSFNVLRENLSYNPRALRATWPSRFPTDEIAAAFSRQPQKLANYVYANQGGNGPAETNDGWNYRGGGLIQLTFKNNYAAAEKALGIPLVRFPVRIEHPRIAALSAAWFWQSHGLNEIADSGDFEKVTETINGPKKLHHEERLANLKRLLEVIK